jgi:ATP-dependent Lon protease
MEHTNDNALVGDIPVPGDRDITTTNRSDDEILRSSGKLANAYDEGAETPTEADENVEKRVFRVPSLERQTADEFDGIDPSTLTPETLPSGPNIDLVSAHDVLVFSAKQGGRTTDSDVVKRNRNIVRTLLHRGHFRQLATLPQDWERRIAVLFRDYPHFEPFLRYVLAMCRFAESDNGVVEMEFPILNGPPGTGKSTIVEPLAQIIGGSYVRVPMSAAEAGNLLGGSQESWSNSRPGLVFDALVDGQHGNPVFLLDELDKVSGDGRFDPLGPCYQLLEPAQSRHFCDLSVAELPLNASKILWFATSNDATKIPSAIRQRFEQFDIPVPTPEQSIAVIRSVFRWLQKERPRLSQFVLSEDAQAALQERAPRDVRKALVHACATAAQAGREVVRARDIPGVVSQAHRMGF